MSKYDEFIKIVTTAPETSIFVDNIQTTDYGLKYLFDGYVLCAIVEYDGEYYDVHDVSDEAVAKITPVELKMYNRFKTPEAIADRMVEDFSRDEA